MTIICCECGGKHELIIGDQGLDCATFKTGKNNLVGAYGSKHDMTVFEVAIDNHPILNYPNNSNFCDDCVDSLVNDSTLRIQSNGSYAFSLFDDFDPEEEEDERNDAGRSSCSN